MGAESETSSMYVRFEQPSKPTSGRLGLLLGHASVGPLNPALPDVELTSFGIWQGADGTVKVTVPSNGNNFPHISGRPVLRTVTEEGKAAVTETSPSMAGKAEIGQLCGAIGKVWSANAAQRFAAGQKFELEEMNLAIADMVAKAMPPKAVVISK